MKAAVLIEQVITIEVDETKFTEEWMAEFRESFYPFFTIKDHLDHIAQMQARGVIDLEMDKNDFIEGYGPASEMGIKLVSSETTVDAIWTANA